jgi:two-component system sensor histidine kinase HydH
MLQRFNRYFGNVSAWLVIGMSGILVVVVLSLALMNYNREKEYMVKILSEKGASLIRAFEAGARTGMMGGFGTSPRLDTLIKEMAMQQDILYISIVDSSGIILAHNITNKIGGNFLAPDPLNSLEATTEVKWRAVRNVESAEAFEVYKLFLPVLPKPDRTQMMKQRSKMMQTRMGAWCDPQWMTGLHEDKLLNPNERPIIVIGMDISTFEEAIQADIKLTVVISGILLLLGLAGVVSLFWAQNYTRSRRLLRNVSAFSSEMIANLPEGIIFTDNDFKVHYINRIASEMLGVDNRKAVGLNSDDILPAKIYRLNTSTTGEEVVETETEIRQKDGKVIPASVISTKVITEDGTFVGLMYILKDLTLLKQLQLEIQRKDKLAVIGNLAAGVAHEVRNPLSSIKGYATYFKSLFPANTENRKAAEVLISETDRLNRVITELLEISRPSEIKPQQTDLRLLIDTTLRLIAPDAETGSKVEITQDVADSIQHVFIDPDRFTQVLMNIYLNSIQAMPEGGLLHTRVDQVHNQVVIIISDTGIGLSDEARSKMFNPYFTTKTTGTGLGLPIVQRIVEAHNGVITVSSEKGKGTTVTIAIPNTF